ncbi:hypothetical protein SAMN04487904_103168 [Actinopolyspora lacussalsi subsp. righensis]|uniref:Uncharacterized protein n=1 Tax=Actinopolyspora righensis TaxID=995060 RepID=A0A1I6YTB3_9ACTN|nr:DUF6114 domain-containing protein [Actinopolyspora righensis]SFT53471.1 hypothetical protein SAMN04487904_103168 [Actinopolyspora righensis]
MRGTIGNRGGVPAVLAGFRRWRRTRPFWGGLFTLLAALLLLYPPYASLKFGDIEVSLRTTAGISALVIGVVMIACALSFWIRPEWRLSAGIVALLLSLVALVVVNLGSFLVGTTLGVIGSSLAIAWSPRRAPGRETREATADHSERSERGRRGPAAYKPSPVPRENGSRGGETAELAEATRIGEGDK